MFIVLFSMFLLPVHAGQVEDMDDLLALNLEDLIHIRVETVSKYSQKSIDAAAIIEVITAKDIQNFGANSLLEVLDRASSISMSGTFFFPQNSVSMRGGLSTGADHHVLLLLNGRPMRDSFSGGENFSYFTAVPLNIIKQIEIIRGPGSVLYGSNAYTGVINLITKNADEIEQQVTLETGRFSSTGVQASSYLNQGDLALSVAVKWFKEDGWGFNAIDNNGNWGSFDAGENNLGLVINAQYNAINFNGLLTSAKQDFWGATSTWQANTQPPSSNLQVQSQRVLLDFGYKHTFNDDHYLDANLSYNTQHFSHINYDSFSKNVFFELSHHWQVSKELHWLIGGSAWHQNVYSEPKVKVAPVPKFSQVWLSLYSQAQYRSSKNVEWTLGAQINKIPDVSANLVPRIGVVYQINENSGIKVNYGQAFRAAYGVETHFDLVICCREDGTNKGGLRGNPSLKPETITTLDAQYFYHNGQSKFGFSVFHSKQTDLIERERAADRVLDFINRGELMVQGLELEYRYAFNRDSQFITSYTFQENKTKAGIENFTLAPSAMFKIGFTHVFEKIWNRNIKLAVYNAHFKEAFDNIIRHPNRKEVNPTAKGYNMLTANLHFPLNIDLLSDKEKAYVEIYGYNLLDEDIYQPEVAGGQINTNPLRAGRSLYLSLTLPF